VSTNKSPKAGITWKGFVLDTDPRYRSGWNYLSGKNLNPRSEKASKEQVNPEQEAAVAAVDVKHET
jgi:hypothetical protein